jgi:ABC-type multidrug transport system ATPase subunit
MDEILVISEMVKNRKTPLFAPVSLSLKRGEGLAVVGYNGSGKTTLLDVVAGLLTPDRGTCSVYGRVGYVMQRDGLQPSLSCMDNLLLEAGLCGLGQEAARERALSCAKVCGAQGYLRKPIAKCSGGMRCKVAVAAALIPGPDLLVLDESLGPLDAAAREQVLGLLRSLKAQGAALVMVSHNPADFIGLCELRLTLPEARVERVGVV